MKIPKAPSPLEEKFNLQIRAMKLPKPEREYRFHPTRKWRFDFAWPELKIAVEVQGGLGMNGRHNRKAGYENDLEKIGEAQLMGWTVYCCGASLINSGKAIESIEMLIELAKENNKK